MVIYLITNNVTSKSYVGITTRNIETRWKEHCSSGYVLYKSICKHGSDNFSIKIVDTAMSEEELLSKECMWINKLDTLYPNGYNMTTGGELNKNMSIESRKKMSIAQTGSCNNNYGTHTTAKAIYCVNNNKTYISATEAANKLNLDRSNIVRVARKQRKHTKGYIFEYKDVAVV